MVADAAHYAEGLAEELAPLVVKLAADYRYVAATATTFGKNLLPRVAALLDVPQISDLTEIVDNTTLYVRFMQVMHLKPCKPIQKIGADLPCDGF
ncbi:EtfA protein [Neisseria gonorrhoeae]|uniref:EtfA protein n=1 Tax=Neisseria gonorrhoeae TaxID=485 RepID=A0A378W1I9_NEIGO|nr:EtfA protein [Neisseria gonorrhoeae]